MTDPIKPSRRDRFRPAELLVMSLIVALFIGIVVWGSTRDFTLGIVFGGIAFIVALIVLATLAITTVPDRAEIEDLAEQDADQSDRKGPGGH